MANNLVSYQRFTALPPNIAAYGATVEELELQRGKPDPNPVLSPMAEKRVADTRLALGAAGSDRLRLGTPKEPTANPYEGSRSTVALSRNALRKLSSHTLGELQDLVQTSGELDESLKSLMSDSLRRVAGLREYLGELIRLTEAVYARCISTSKG